MKPRFDVLVIGFSILTELEGAWRADDYLALLDSMEFGDTSGIASEELRDLCLLSLQDHEPRDAAALVLKHRLQDRLTAGEIRNLANEALEEKLWEEYAGMQLHEEMFNVASLLHSAFPRTFPEPDAVQVKLTITAANELAEATLAKSLTEAFLVRLLADGMDENAILQRLFEEQLGGRSFPEADAIVWIAHCEPRGRTRVEVDVISSGYWLDPLRHTSAYESNAYPDEIKTPPPR